MYAPVAGLLSGANVDIFNEVDTILERSLAVGDPLIALEYAHGLQKESLVKGLAISKLMYKLKQNWSFFEVAGVGDTFENIVEANGYKPSTLEKYIRMWESIFENPVLSEDLKNKLSGRPIRDLLLLTAAAREGSLSDADWEHVTVAGDGYKVREIVRKARGQVTSSASALIPKVQWRNEGALPVGALYFYSKDELKVFGKLELNSEDEDVKKMVERTINRLGIKET